MLAALARMGKENQAGAMARLAAWIKRQVQFLIIMRTQGPVGAPDRDVVAAATAAGRILISLDRGLGDIRAYPPGSHAGIVVLRLTDQSAAAAIKAVSDLATLTDLDSLAGAVASFSADYCASATHNHVHGPHRAPSIEDRW